MAKMTISPTIKPIANAIFKELFLSVALLLSLTLMIYVLMVNAPGSELFIASGNANATSSRDVAQPVYLFLTWIGLCLSGDFGVSLTNGLPVLAQVTESMGYSITLIFYALLLSVIFTLTTVSLQHVRIIHSVSGAVSLIASLLSLFPVFWLSYLFIYVFSIWFNRLPIASDPQSISLIETIIPVILLSLGSGVVAQMTLHSKNELCRVLQQEYILFARAKGANIYRHVMKEGVIFPLLNMISHRVAYLFGTSIIIEQIFSWPGIGRLLWQSAQQRDIPMLLCAVLITALIIRLVQFGANVIYILLNPRASHQ